MTGRGKLVNDQKSIARREPDENVLAVRARDNRLVSRILAGDNEAFEELVRAYYDRIRGLVYHHLHSEDELDDALQDIFVKAFQALPKFRRRSGFYTWLYRIASNYCVDRLRKRRLELVSLDVEETRDAVEARIPETGETPDDRVSRSERVKMVRKALTMLDPLHQNIIVLREIQGLSYDEICESLGVGMGTVKSRLARARAELKKILTDMDVI
jgi:RNA polymerase sigma-70 factor (ECF subfamily)